MSDKVRENYDPIYYVDTSLDIGVGEGYTFDIKKLPLKSGLIDDFSYFSINNFSYKETLDLLSKLHPASIFTINYDNEVVCTYGDLRHDDLRDDDYDDEVYDLLFEQDQLFEKINSNFEVSYIEKLLNDIKDKQVILHIIIGQGPAIDCDYFIIYNDDKITCYIFEYLNSYGDEFVYCDYKPLNKQ